MKIESIIKRDPPTRITLGDTAYQFEPDSEGRHVCEVSDQEHLARLLSIPEGYRLVMEGQPAPQPKHPEPVKTEQPTIKPADEDEGEDDGELKGSNVHPEEIDLGEGRTVRLEDVLSQAFEQSGMTRQEWNEQDEDDRYAKIDAVLDSMVAPEQDVTEDGTDDSDATEGDTDDQPKLADDLSRDELADLYDAKFGKRPHGKWSPEKIREELEKDAE